MQPTTLNDMQGKTTNNNEEFFFHSPFKIKLKIKWNLMTAK